MGAHTEEAEWGGCMEGVMVVASVAAMGELMVDMAAELGWDQVVEEGVAFKQETDLDCNLDYNGSRR